MFSLPILHKLHTKSHSWQEKKFIFFPNQYENFLSGYFIKWSDQLS